MMQAGNASIFKERLCATGSAYWDAGLPKPFGTQSVALWVPNASSCGAARVGVCSPALGLALIVDNVRWGKNFFRSAFYIPVLISGIVSGFIWKIMYNYNFGTFNAVLGNLGLDSWKQDWLGNSSLTLIMIGIVLIWKGAGYYMIIYLASLQSVSTDLIEAAQIDGASPWQRFKSITIPLISGAFTINFTLSLINGLKVFDQINVMTDGGPGFTSETLVYLLYKVGFNEGRQGFGTAVGIMLLFIIIVLNTLQQKFLRSREVQM